MPELPEVEVIVRELSTTLPGETITGIEVNWQKTLVLNGCKVPIGRRIQSLSRYGKFIIINLNQDSLLIHLRMTGQLILVRPEEHFSSDYLRVTFDLKSGKKLLYYDARKFGRIYVTCCAENYLKNLGIDLLSPDFTLQKMQEILSRRKSKIKSLLLDQSHFAGLGNIYSDESLFKAGIHPDTPAHKISQKRIASLYLAIKETILMAIENMGTTISDYKTTGGGFGNNQYYLKVYGRENETCYECGGVIKKIRVNNRGTHFCPKCQPKRSR
jgi:formamidopyrimidine-DNA glycosylase